jgi:hypothetical protein
VWVKGQFFVKDFLFFWGELRNMLINREVGRSWAAGALRGVPVVRVAEPVYPDRAETETY